MLVSRLAEASWEVGRAEMLYRDLVPGREGGRLIASHIRIPVGGPVPDYVHFHTVRFQIIYCWHGWVEVVYQDQGPPFRLEPGDAVLQPPGIRHRVIACSPGLEVIEVASPAEHATAADPGLALPTAGLRPEREFEGQRFHRHRAAGAGWRRRGDLEVRDLGIADAGGLATAEVVRPVGAGAALGGDALLVAVVLTGALSVDGEGRLEAGDAFTLPAGRAIGLGGAASDGCEILAVQPLP